MPRSVEVMRLQAAQVEEAGQALARAFQEDPLYAHVLPDEAHRARALERLFIFTVRYGEQFGEVWTTAGTIDGAAVWIPPDSGAMTQERLDAAGWPAVAEALGEAAEARLDPFLERAGALHAETMPMAHWYLMVLGVEPAWQAQGVGSLLIRPVLARADRDDLPCYLETLKAGNLPFYRKHGFEVVIEGDLSAGPRYWTMRRDARPSLMKGSEQGVQRR
jgi:GNAT superfamily N-acetyltransferase